MPKKEIIFGLSVALFLALAISPFASSRPDGLERVAQAQGFLGRGEGKVVLAACIPDYLFPGVKNERLATAAAGAAGTLLVFALSYGLAALLKRER